MSGEVYLAMFVKTVRNGIGREGRREEGILIDHPGEKEKTGRGSTTDAIRQPNRNSPALAACCEMSSLVTDKDSTTHKSKKTNTFRL